MSLALIGTLTQKTSSNCYEDIEAQKSVGWCAIDSQTGDLYTSEDFDYKDCYVGSCEDQSHHFPYPREILRYAIPWASIPLTDFGGNLILDT